MEDVQHYNQPSYYQQNGNGQSNDQMDEVFIRCCRNKWETRKCHEVNKLLVSFVYIELEVWGKKSLRIPLLPIMN